MAHYSHPTSEGLEAVRRFVKTAHHEKGEGGEDLHTPAHLKAFLEDQGPPAIDVKPADLRRALEVREALRDVMGATNGEPLNPDAVQLLNKTAARAKVVAAFDDHASWRIEPASNGVDGVL